MMRTIIGWGSSSMAGIGPALAVALSSCGTRFVNEGSGGETSHHTAARIGSIPLPVHVEGGRIPSTGTVLLRPTELDLVPDALEPFAGHVAGLPAVVHGTENGVHLTRAVPGDPIVVDGDLFIPLTGTDRRGQDALLWMGKNDLNRGQSAQGVVSRIIATAQWLQVAGARVAVVGQFTNNGATSAERDRVLEVNTACAAYFGPAHLDLQDFLTSPTLPATTGIDPTAEDLAERTVGAKPPSISNDPGHFNQIGNHAVAARIVAGLRGLGWLDPTPSKETT